MEMNRFIKATVGVVVVVAIPIIRGFQGSAEVMG